MLNKLQLMCFEVTNKCNLSDAHDFCPSKTMSREGKPCTDSKFLDFLYYCIQNNFTGNVGFHFFNEPTLDLNRCKFLNDRVHTLGLSSTLWTNGTCKEDLSEFDNVYTIQYAENKDCTKPIPYQPDDRIKIYDSIIEDKVYSPCYRPSIIELPIDYYGNLHLCCSDWDGIVNIGNISTDDFDSILNKWEECRIKALDCSLPLCKKCQSLRLSPALYSQEYIV